MSITSKETIVLNTGNCFVPITVNYNSKKNIRFRFSSRGGAISMPPFLRQSEKNSFIKKGIEWTKEYLKKNSHWEQTFQGDKYEHGKVINTTYRSYPIIRTDFAGKIKGRLKNNSLYLSIPNDPIYQFESLHTIRTCIHKLISKDQLPILEKQVDEVNDQTLQVSINKINLKYNQSNWGSCSTNRNLSFSSRLLFSPEWVIKSVIKHELAHFKEMNHSTAFWNIVKSIDETHAESTKWLKDFSWKCDF